MPRDSNEQVLQGTLDLRILKTLSLGAMHGWGLTQRIQNLSHDRRAKYYRITAAGRRALGDEQESWRRFVQAMQLVLDAKV